MRNQPQDNLYHAVPDTFEQHCMDMIIIRDVHRKFVRSSTGYGIPKQGDHNRNKDISTLAVPDPGTHASLFSAKFTTPLACFLNSHFPALSKKIVVLYHGLVLGDMIASPLVATIGLKYSASDAFPDFREKMEARSIVHWPRNCKQPCFTTTREFGWKCYQRRLNAQRWMPVPYQRTLPSGSVNFISKSQGKR